MKKRRLPPLLGVLCITAILHAETDFWEDLPEAVWVNNMIASMIPEEMVGQVFLYGYIGERASPETLNWMGDHFIGGIKVFGWNTGDLRALVNSIADFQKASQRTRLRIPFLIATDQEGGWVRHVKTGTSATPGNMAVGATGSMEDAYKTGYYIGKELSIIGINTNFAPTVDILTNPDNSVIGPRAFSSDPVETARLSLAYFKGTQAAGIIATAKHFPGHGDTDTDSHGNLPVIEISLEQLWDRELVPYRLLSREMVPVIMSGHLGFPRILDDMTPASLSPYFLQDILRDRLGFKGVIVTDDLKMGGARSVETGIADLAVKALEAGNDLVMISKPLEDQAAAYSLALQKFKTDPAFRGSIIEKVKRILLLKKRYIMQSSLIPDAEKAVTSLPDKEAQLFFFDQACRSITRICGNSIPLPRDTKGKILLVSQYHSFSVEGRKYYENADYYEYSYYPFWNPLPEVLSEVQELIQAYDIVILCLANPNSLGIIESIEGSGKEIYVISVLSPVYIRELPWIENLLVMYGSGQLTFRLAFAALTGIIKPLGKLPLALEYE